MLIISPFFMMTNVSYIYKMIAQIAPPKCKLSLQFELKRFIILNLVCYHQNQHYRNIYVNNLPLFDDDKHFMYLKNDSTNCSPFLFVIIKINIMETYMITSSKVAPCFFPKLTLFLSPGISLWPVRVLTSSTPSMRGGSVNFLGIYSKIM